MITLAFDCSADACAVALCGDGARLAATRAAMGRGQAETLLPMIAKVMAEAGLGWSAVNLIAVTVGPGSFTGIRIVLAAARGIALATGLPVAGVTSTETIAAAVPDAERTGRTLLASVESKRADAFVQAFDPHGTPHGPPLVLPPADLTWHFPGPLLLAGDGAERLAQALPAAALSSVTAGPDAVVLARLAERHFAAGDALPPKPLYLRPPDTTLPGRQP